MAMAETCKTINKTVPNKSTLTTHWGHTDYFPAQLPQTKPELLVGSLFSQHIPVFQPKIYISISIYFYVLPLYLCLFILIQLDNREFAFSSGYCVRVQELSGIASVGHAKWSEPNMVQSCSWHSWRETWLEETVYQRSVLFIFRENELEPRNEQMVAQCRCTVQCSNVWTSCILFVRVDIDYEDTFGTWSSINIISLWGDTEYFYSSSLIFFPCYYYASWEAKNTVEMPFMGSPNLCSDTVQSQKGWKVVPR